MDINDWTNVSGNNPLDLASSAGMAFLALKITSFLGCLHNPYFQQPPYPSLNHGLLMVLRLAMVLVLAGAERMVCHFGLPCGSFVVASRGTTLRTYLSPMGDLKVPSVALGNLLTSRQGWRNEVMVFKF